MRSILMAALLALGGLASGHEAHDSVTEAVFRKETGLLEVTVSVHAGDLELALSKAAGRKIALEALGMAEADSRIADYLASVFLIETADGIRPPMTWVGRELVKPDGHAGEALLRLHFEFPLAGGLEQSRLRQGVFCELFDDQINLVHLRDGGRKLTLGFSPERELMVVSFAK